jgi:hypothetical protein
MDSSLSTEATMVSQAVEYLNLNSRLSLRSVAKQFGVDKSTLSRHRVRSTSRALGQESNQRFSKRHERFLVDWIKSEDARGYAPGRSRVHEMAQKLLEANGDDKPLGRKWIDGFKRRNSDISTLIGKRIASERHNGATREVLETHFQRFKRIIDDYAVKSENIWNMDETGTQLGASIATKVLGDAKKKSTIVKKPNETEWVSVIECISSAGKAMKPLIIFKGKSVQLQWFNSSEVPDWEYTTSTNGWTSNEIGLKWLTSIFIPETATKPEDWRVLVVDGHGSHISVNFMFECRINKIQLFFLPPHTSHVTQPLDLSCFSPIKGRYRKEIQELASLDDSAKVKKERFISAYNKARTESLTSRTIRSGFLASGMVPFNPDKALNSRFVRAVENTTKTPNRGSNECQIEELSPATPYHYAQCAQIATKFGNRTARKQIRRAGKRVELLATQIVEKDIRIRRLETTLAPLLRKQKRKKVPIAPEEQFVNIEAIKAAQEASKAEDRRREEREEIYQQKHPQSEYENASSKVLEQGYQGMLFEFYLD